MVVNCAAALSGRYLIDGGSALAVEMRSRQCRSGSERALMSCSVAIRGMSEEPDSAGASAGSAETMARDNDW